MNDSSSLIMLFQQSATIVLEGSYHAEIIQKYSLIYIDLTQ